MQVVSFAQGKLTCHLGCKAHTARAVYTSRHDGLHQRSQVLVMDRPLHLCESAAIAAKVHRLHGAHMCSAQSNLSQPGIWRLM